jgi:hypothetical protein
MKNNPNRWSRYHKCCKKCQTTKHKHVQKGYCTKCWAVYRYKKYKTYHKKYSKNYWLKNKDLLKAKNRIYYLKRKDDKNNNIREASVSESNIQNNQQE